IEASLYENGPNLDGRMFLSDANIEFLARSVYPFAGKPIILRDQANDRDRERNAVPGLEIRIGARKATWRFIRDTVDHGERDYIMSAKYAIRQMLLQGRALRGYQRRVSARMLQLCGEDPSSVGRAPSSEGGCPRFDPASGYQITARGQGGYGPVCKT